MSRQVLIKNVGNVTLTDNNFVGAGGEAAVHRQGNHAIKVYHDEGKTLPEKKIIELGNIRATNVLKPLHSVYDTKTNNLIGYAMQYVDGTHPICKLFTKSFRNKYNIDHRMIYKLVNSIQETAASIHFDKCLIVDFNEMNLLTSSDFKIPYFIDVDSYQTPSFPATALMESIRDHTSPLGKFSIYTDWFAFGILAFQLYIGIHPFKGRHPNYKPGDWQQRMEDGISVFNKDVQLPPVCNPFAIIPPRHKDWFEDMFVNNNRSEPPRMDSSEPITMEVKRVVINSTNLFDIKEIVELESKFDIVTSAYSFVGQKHYVTQDRIYAGKRLIQDGLAKEKNDKILLASSPTSRPVICKLKDKFLSMYEMDGGYLGKIPCKGATVISGRLLAVSTMGLTEVEFKEYGGKLTYFEKVGSGAGEHSRLFDGVLCQNLLGKPFLTVPTESGFASYKTVELEDYRVIDMKLERNICVLMAEKKGIYYRFVFIFDHKKHTYDLRITKDVPFDAINFTVTRKGICILSTENNQLELFRDNRAVKVVENSPIDSSMTLFSFDNTVYFAHENKVMSITMK
jgi:hypothetical protein